MLLNIKGKRYRVRFDRLITMLVILATVGYLINWGIGFTKAEPTPAVQQPMNPVHTSQEPPKPVKVYYKVPLSHEVQDIVFRRCAELELDPVMVFAVMKAESSFRNIVSADGEDFGLMQINKVNIDRLAEKVGRRDPMDVYTNILMGTELLSECREHWKRQGLTGHDLDEAMLSSYNKGINGHKTYGVARGYVNNIRHYREAIKNETTSKN